jgi:hypothetical protein
LLGVTHTNLKIDWSRPAGWHRCPIDSPLGEGAHRNVLYMPSAMCAISTIWETIKGWPDEVKRRTA